MIDTKELRLIVQDYKLAGSPVFIQAADMDEILDRLEAAEKERDDAKAAAENIALKLDYLRSKLETAKNAQNDWLRANAPGGWIDNLRIENEALRAKVEQMERQELGYRERCTPSSPAGGSNRFPLYALPGAKGE